ncbi:hypothetical protein D3C84_1246250 [compost metagenome]
MEVTSEIHESVIDLIGGLTKMENALHLQMKALLAKPSSSSGLGTADDSSLDFSFGEDEKL